MNKVILEYFIKFGEEPPIILTMNEEDEKYIELLRECIAKHKPLTISELNEIFNNGKII